MHIQNIIRAIRDYFAFDPAALIPDEPPVLTPAGPCPRCGRDDGVYISCQGYEPRYVHCIHCGKRGPKKSGQEAIDAWNQLTSVRHP